jgi:hypothetical protein
VDPDYSWARRDDWVSAWQPAVDAIGTDFGPAGGRPAADDIERGQVRRFLEPLEFDCPLHHDPEVARAHGYDGVVAPYSGLAAWTSIGVWSPGDEPVYTDDHRDAQPRLRPGSRLPSVGPSTNAGFATDVTYTYERAFVVGDHLRVRGPKLVAVTPKETKVGRGAFLTWESTVHDRDGALVATTRIGSYRYVAGEA